MKVLLLAPQPFYIDRGTPIDVDLMLRALSARGDRVDALVYPEGDERTYPNITLHRVRSRPGSLPAPPGFSLRKLRYDGEMFRAARRLARANRYDVVHAGEEAVFIAQHLQRAHGLPYVYDMDSSIAQQMVEKMSCLRPAAAFFNWCEARAIRGCLAAAPVCNALADLARREGAPFVETLHDISQMADEDFRATGELRRELSVSGPLVVYCGNLERYQGVDLLLESFAWATRNGLRADLALAGGAPGAIAAYRARAAALGIGLRAHFIGPRPLRQLGSLLAEADVLVSPRILGVNTPMKIFPYLHSGKAVLVTDLHTHTQILTPEVARIAPPEPAAFGRALRELLDDAALRQRLGEAGRAFVRREHTFDAHVRRVNRLYDYVADALRRRKESAA